MVKQYQVSCPYCGSKQLAREIINVIFIKSILSVFDEDSDEFEYNPYGEVNDVDLSDSSVTIYCEGCDKDIAIVKDDVEFMDLAIEKGWAKEIIVYEVLGDNKS